MTFGGSGGILRQLECVETRMTTRAGTAYSQMEELLDEGRGEILGRRDDQEEGREGGRDGTSMVEMMQVLLGQATTRY